MNDHLAPIFNGQVADSVHAVAAIVISQFLVGAVKVLSFVETYLVIGTGV
jgi:hypothetical protein